MNRFIRRAVLMLTLTAFALTTNCLPPLVTTIAQKLAVPISLFGWLFTLQYAMFAASAFASNSLQRRRPIHNRTFVLIGLSGLAAVLFAAPAFGNVGDLILLVVLLGIAGGLVESHGSVIVSEIDRGRPTQYLNLSQAFFCLGGIVAPSLVAYLFRYDLTWQWMLVILGAIVAVVALAFGLVRGGKARGTPETNAREPLADPSLVAQRFTLIALSAVMFFYTFSESTVVSWLPSLLQVARSLSRATAAGLLGSFWLGVMVTRFAMFFYSPRRSITVIIAGGLVLAGLGVAALWAGVDGTLILPLVWFIGLAFGPLWPSIVALARSSGSGSDLTVTVIGVGGVGAAAGPLVSSRIIRTAGIASVQPVLLVVMGLELITLVVFLIVRAGRVGAAHGAERV